MPLQATSGAASYDAFGGGVVAEPNYIESCFSTWLYTGNGSTQTINNGIDLAGKGGLVWQKSRDTTAGYQHVLYDTVRGSTSALFSSVDNDAVTSGGTYTTTFSSTGFQTNTSGGNINQSGNTQVSWTFRKQPKFFDVQTWTNGVVNHNLDSVPGCVIYKSTTNTQNWFVIARKSDGTYEGLNLNTTGATQGTAPNAAAAGLTATTFDSRVFFGGTGTLVGYFFAHNAGGFGLTGTDNVISCGSYAGTGSPVPVTLGYEPQWIMIKNITTGGDGYNWMMVDNMRGIPTSGDTPILFANTSGAEEVGGQGNGVQLNATGFTVTSPYGALNNSGNTYIYIAIRRGPMRTPTTGTSVFTPIASEFNEGQVNTTNFPVDLQISRIRGVTNNTWAVDRLRGVLTRPATGNAPFLSTNLTNAEANSTLTRNWNNTGFETAFTQSGWATAYWNFRRAPGFFDEVCYTGTGVDAGITHNLGVVPEMIIYKERANADVWRVGTNFTPTTWNATFLNQTSSGTDLTYGTTRQYTAKPTATQFFVSSFYNDPSQRNVVYLFASCPGVSKVFSYTGNGSSQTINCGFTGGARFVMIKRTDSTGDWYVWDTARGIVANNDPHLSLNTTAAEVTTNDTIDTDSTGFVVNQVAATNVNVSSATYIGLAIA